MQVSLAKLCPRPCWKLECFHGKYPEAIVQNPDWFHLVWWGNGLTGCGGFLLTIARDGFSLITVIYHDHLCSLGIGTFCRLMHNTISEGGNVITFNELEDFTQSNLTWIVIKVPYKQPPPCDGEAEQIIQKSKMPQKGLLRLGGSPSLIRPVFIWLLEWTKFICS